MDKYGNQFSILLSLGELEQNGVKKFVATMRLQKAELDQRTVDGETIQAKLESLVELSLQTLGSELKQNIFENLAGAYKVLEEYGRMKRSGSVHSNLSETSTSGESQENYFLKQARGYSLTLQITSTSIRYLSIFM